MDCLGKASLVGADFLVSRILGRAVGIAYLGIHYSIDLLEVMLSTPEAASGKIYLLQIFFFHIVPFYVLLCIRLTRQQQHCNHYNHNE
jgi:TRAP-type C4-dicarboxylate transport system permease small subunit